MPTVEVVIKTTEQGAKQATQGLTQSLTGLAAKYLAVGTVATTTYKVVKDSIETTMKYAQEVRNLAQASGTSAEQASRLLQVLDDWEISAQDVTAATRFMTKNGLTPTLETIAKLSDEYLKINDAQERNAFILKNLGRGGLQWVNVLNQGSEALLKQGQAVNKNLILTDKQIKQTEEYRLAMDNLKDTIEGWKVAAVTGFLEAKKAGDDYAEALRVVSAEHGLNFDQMVRARASSKEFNAEIEQEIADLKRAGEMGEYYRNQAKGIVNTTDTATVSLDGFNEQIKQLGSYISGDLGPAQDDYNAKIAEYQKQLKEAKTQEEKMGIQAQIDAETEAYNKRASAIIFNIQQEAILAAVQSGQITDAGQAVTVLNNLAYTYGLVDEKTKAVSDSTAEAVQQFIATGNAEVFVQQLKNIEQNSQKAVPPIQNLKDNTYHLGKRSTDAADQLAELKDSQSALAQGVNHEAGPAVGFLKQQIDGLQSKSINIDVWVKQHGGVSSSTGWQGTMFTTGSQAGLHPGGGGMWTGGDLGPGWTLVGDMPGGQLGPYTEAIYNGHVFNARETRELYRQGVLGNAQSMYYASEGPGTFTPGGYGMYGYTPKKKGGGGGGIKPKITPHGGGGGNSPSEQAASATAALVLPVMSQAATATMQAASVATMTGGQQTNLLASMDNTLKQLLAAQGTPTRNAKAQQEAASAFS